MDILSKIGCLGEKALIGVEYNCLDSTIHTLRTRYLKGKLLILESQNFANISDFQKYLLQWPASPLLLRLKNAQALEKWISVQEKDKIKAVLGVPVETPKNFVYEEIAGGSEQHLISLIRKETFMQALNAFGSHKERLIGCYLSEASACFLLPALARYAASSPYLLKGSNTYAWKGGLLQTIEKGVIMTPEDLGKELDIAQQNLYLYASILLFYLGDQQQTIGLSNLIQNRSRQRKLSKLSRGLSVGLALFLCLTIFSLITQTWFSYQHQQAAIKLTDGQATLDLINARRTNLREKTDFLSGSHQKSLLPSQIAWQLDQVAALAPKKLEFGRIIFHPKTKQLKKIDTRLESRELDLLIQGESTDAHALTAFSIQLQELPWIQQAEIFNSTYDYRDQKLHFILLLKFEDGEIH